MAEAKARTAGITCSDNGIGLGDDQVKAYVTKDTSYKDDLTIEGIGKCKGSGRIQFLHYFSKLEVDSTYKSGANYVRRHLSIDTNTTKEIDEKSFSLEPASKAETKTIYKLDTLKPEIYERFFKDRDVRNDFCASSLKSHLLIAFLQRFVGLKDRLGDFTVKFKSSYKSTIEEASFSKDDLPPITLKKLATIHHNDANGNPAPEAETFTISHYKLNKAAYKLKCNLVALCAKASTVKIITNKYLKSKALENRDIDGFYHIILIESPYLDDRVNEHRDDFNIFTDAQMGDIFLKDEITWEQIHDGIRSDMPRYMPFSNLTAMLQ